MSLITPDFGLIVWMTLIFGIVFFILSKFGFPIVTGMVDKRNQRIADSIKLAKEAEARMAGIVEEQKKLLDEARREQARILKETSAARDAMIAKATSDAKDEAAKILAKAAVDIEAEKESAMRDVRRQVAVLSVKVAEKVLGNELSEDKASGKLVDSLLDEMSEIR